MDLLALLAAAFAPARPALALARARARIHVLAHQLKQVSEAEQSEQAWPATNLRLRLLPVIA